MRIEEIKAKQTHPLRQSILRPHQPIEEMLYPLDLEANSFHVGAYNGNQIIGVASIFPESQSGELHSGHWRLRGMAVADEFRGQGIGHDLVLSCIEYVNAKKGKSIWCNARSTAIGFYLRIGFKQLGDEFEIAGIGPHFIAVLDLEL